MAGIVWNMQTITDSRFGFKIYLADAMMHGDQTEKSVLRALDTLCQLKMELIVIARGGGSKTDLYYLDNEAIARKIADCSIPVWTGIGHEIDKSVLDYVANKSFKTPTAIAEEIVARFVQMRRQLDESRNSLKTVWDYRIKNAQDYIVRSITGIKQGTRKLLDVTTSGLRVRAQEISLCVKERIASEQVRIQVSKEKLRSQPGSIIKNNFERLQSRKQDLRSRAKFALSSSIKNIKGLRFRFERDRFLRRLQVEQDRKSKVSLQLKSRFRALCNVKIMQYRHLQDRLKIEKILHRVFIEKKSLSEKMATLKAADPKSALQRGFALVYRQDGRLIRSVNDVNEKDKINTNVADGYITSEVTLKRGKNE